jgi:hypothetical protein
MIFLLGFSKMRGVARHQFRHFYCATAILERLFKLLQQGNRRGERYGEKTTEGECVKEFSRE